MPPNAARIVVVPVPTPVASPELLIVATHVREEDHDTRDVMLLVLPSEYIPVAVNCFFAPLEMDGLTGVTLMDCSTGLVTVKVAEPEMLPETALTVDVPIPAPVARPLLWIVATDRFEEDHLTFDVMFFVLPSV